MGSHPGGPATVLPSADVYRVARSGGVERFSRITPQDAQLSGAGNRFDVVGGGVIYAATRRRTCFAETLARFRVPAQIRAIVEELDRDDNRMICGGVAADWRARRVAATLAVDEPLPFVDVTDPQTHDYLTSELADLLTAHDLDVFDLGVVQGRNRQITRGIATWAYTATDQDGKAEYSGIRYESRVDGEECWAIFDGTPLVVKAQDIIDASDPDLVAVADTFGLRVY